MTIDKAKLLLNKNYKLADLRVIAKKKFGIENREKLIKKAVLIDEIAIDSNLKKLRRLLQPTKIEKWWDKYHNHIYGIFGLIGIVLSIIFWKYPSSNQGLDQVIDSFKGLATLDRLMDTPIDELMITASFNEVKKEDISLLLFSKEGISIRIEFLAEGVQLTAEGSPPFLDKSIILPGDNGSLVVKIVDLKYMRRSDSSHPLSKLTLRKLDNIDVIPLIRTSKLSQFAGNENEICNFRIVASSSGFGVRIINENIYTNEKTILAFKGALRIPEYPGFSMISMLTWKTILEKPVKLPFSFSI